MNCLICGKILKHIGCHLQFIHKMTTAEYSLKFSDAKLVDEVTSKKYSEATKESYTPELRETRKQWREKWHSNKIGMLVMVMFGLVI